MFCIEVESADGTYPLTCRELENGGLKRNMKSFETTPHGKTTLFVIGLAVLLTVLSGCSGGALTTREKGAGIGALGGAAEPLA